LNPNNSRPALNNVFVQWCKVIPAMLELRGLGIGIFNDIVSLGGERVNMSRLNSYLWRDTGEGAIRLVVKDEHSYSEEVCETVGFAAL